MARPQKIGLSYYSIDTDRYQNIKMKMLKKNFSGNGVAVYDYIICEIYRVKGCFIVWDENTAFDVSDYFGLKETTVKEIVNYCVSVGLWDKGVLQSENVLTSLSIQKRYAQICIDAKRKDWLIPELIKLPRSETKLKTEETIVNTVVSTHRIEENRIVKNSKEECVSAEIENLKNSEQWLESILIKFKPITKEKIFIRLDEFKIHLTSLQKEFNNRLDLIRHFQNWLRKLPEEKQSKISVGKQDYSKKL